jgi:hypothetical protein
MLILISLTTGDWWFNFKSTPYFLAACKHSADKDNQFYSTKYQSVRVSRRGELRCPLSNRRTHVCKDNGPTVAGYMMCITPQLHPFPWEPRLECYFRGRSFRFVKKTKIYGKGEADKVMALQGRGSLGRFVHKSGNQNRRR